MKLADLLPLMNIYDITIQFAGEKIECRPGNRDDIIDKLGEKEVYQITNVCKLGDVVWVR